MSQFFASGGQGLGASTSASVLPMNTQDWSPLGWTGWISLHCKGLLRVFSSPTVQMHEIFSAQPSFTVQPLLCVNTKGGKQRGEEGKKVCSSLTPPTRAAPPRPRQQAGSQDRWALVPLGPRKGPSSTASWFPRFCPISLQGPPWLWGGWGCWEGQGVAPRRAWGSPSLHTPVSPSASAPDSLSDLRLSLKPVFAELAWNKDLETRVSKIQTWTSFKKPSEEPQPFCETLLANTAKGAVSHFGYRHATSPYPQIKLEPLPRFARLCAPSPLQLSCLITIWLC